MSFVIYQGDCLEIMRSCFHEQFDACVTDPPYGINFMAKGWDYDVPQKETWEQVFRVLKPGAHLLAFFSARTFHRGVVQIEDAGFEIRDQIMWIFGSGFPKSHDQGDGWASALKPAHEPIVVARKPLEGSLKSNFKTYGTGALNIDRSRSNGRWPANIVHDGSESAIQHFPHTNGASSVSRSGVDGITTGKLGPQNLKPGFNDSGSAARYFYCAKATKKDREEGLDDAEAKWQAGAEFRPNHMEKAQEGSTGNPYGRWDPRKNNHPTVKPTDLMRYLCTLVTPPGGTVLDPFMGSGSTGKGAAREDFHFVGIEKDPEYFKIAQARLVHAYDKGIMNYVRRAKSDAPVG
jgi:DNA modification methylase